MANLHWGQQEDVPASEVRSSKQRRDRGHKILATRALYAELTACQGVPALDLLASLAAACAILLVRPEPPLALLGAGVLVGDLVPS